LIDMSVEAITFLMVAGIIVGVMTGFPLAFVVGSVGLIMGYLLLGNASFEILYSRLYSLSLNYPLLAVPLFTFMGVVLQRSGIADGLFDALYLWLGGFRGGLAVATVLFGTVLAACLGVITASVTMLTLIALTPMVKRGYNKSLASGAVCAGGTLGILIPPSVMLVIYGPMAMVSVGKLFMAAFMPGLLLCGLYCTYVAVACLRKPDWGPPVPKEDRNVPFMVKTRMLLYSLVPPALLIISVLGTIFLGIAPPTEAASVGAFAAMVLAILYRKFSWNILSPHDRLSLLRVRWCVHQRWLRRRCRQGHHGDAWRKMGRLLHGDVHRLYPRHAHRLDRHCVYHGADTCAHRTATRIRPALVRHDDLREPSDVVYDSSIRGVHLRVSRHCGARIGCHDERHHPWRDSLRGADHRWPHTVHSISADYSLVAFEDAGRLVAIS
jgi:hypothetical protein